MSNNNIEKGSIDSPENNDKLRRKCLEIADSIPGGFGPTAHRKVMAVMMLPESEHWTVLRKCDIIGVSPRHWYRIINSPDFSDNLATVQKRFKGQYAAGVFKAFIAKALFGDADGRGNVTAQLAYLRDMGIIEPERRHFDHTGIETRSKEELVRELTVLGISPEGDNLGSIAPSDGDSTGTKTPS